MTANSSNATFSLTPSTSNVDTNCSGCNTRNGRGLAVQRFAATLAGGSPAAVNWSVSGGDGSAGAGSIDVNGEYTPPGYLTADQARVVVTARLKSDPNVVASAQITVTPGFLQPLTPENLALGPGGSVTLTGRLAEAGGRANVQFALASSPNGSGSGLGTLSTLACQHSSKLFTTCSVTYTAPPNVSGTAPVYVIATSGQNASRTEAEILLNSAAVTSNPTAHQEALMPLMALGSSGGNNNDFDGHGNNVADCCSGTLGALIQDNAGRQYLLSNNHVLARSDQASIGDPIVQPGLIDNNCTPYGDGPGTLPVASLSAWLPLSSSQTNVDAAIAQVAAHTVDTSGTILELGVRQADGTLAAAPPGISSSNGHGEQAALQMHVVKSGRTTGLTCASVSAVDLDVSVDYFRDCAETKPYLTKVFTHQMAMTGDRFSDAGDSGSLVLDANNAEPVGLFFAGGTDAAGVGQGVANPAPEVLTELGTLAGSSTTYTFVGGADHAVSCLNYGDGTTTAAQSTRLPDAQITRAEDALYAARSLVNPGAGILGVAMGKSTDHPGEAAIVVYVAEDASPSVPATIDGVRTVVVASTAQAVAFGTAPLSNALSGTMGINGNALSRAMLVKQRNARSLMAEYPAFFGVGVGQSLDNPREASLVIYVDRNRLPASLPASIDGVRTRYIVMDRLHVTRSYALPGGTGRHCLSHSSTEEDPERLLRDHARSLF